MRLFSITALCLTLLATAPVTAAPKDFGQGTHIGRYTGVAELPDEVRTVYARFKREAKYFAAMAVNIEAKGGFYIQNFHDLSRVRAAAMEGCRQLYGKTGCQIYAVAVPTSLPVTQSKASGFSMLAADDFHTVYREHRKPGTYAAFAISGASHHGYGNAYASQADARDTAIAYCMIGVTKDMAELGPEARRFARARRWNTCTVVDVEFTPAQ